MHSLFRTQGIGRTIGMLSLIFVLVFILIPGSNAAAEGAIVYMERLVGTFVGFTIDFPNEISGDFAGTINGKHFDCETIPPNKLYCMGPFAYWSGAATLHIYVKGSGEVILSKVILPPNKNGTDPDPDPAPLCVCNGVCSGECFVGRPEIN
jgi:hypothetical protein